MLGEYDVFVKSTNSLRNGTESAKISMFPCDISLYASIANTIIFRGKKILDGIKINMHVQRYKSRKKCSISTLPS